MVITKRYTIPVQIDAAVFAECEREYLDLEAQLLAKMREACEAAQRRQTSDYWFGPNLKR